MYVIWILACTNNMTYSYYFCILNNISMACRYLLFHWHWTESKSAEFYRIEEQCVHKPYKDKMTKKWIIGKSINYSFFKENKITSLVIMIIFWRLWPLSMKISDSLLVCVRFFRHQRIFYVFFVFLYFLRIVFL